MNDPNLQNIADENVSRLIARSYLPETPDADFAERVRARLHAAASQHASHPAPSPASAESRPPWWKLATFAAIAASLVWAMFSFVARPSRPVARDSQAIIEPRAGRDEFSAWINNEKALPAAVHLVTDRLKPRVVAPAAAPTSLALGSTLATGRSRQRVTLPDGTVVYADQGTRLALTGPRMLKLAAGEVFVEVAQQKHADGKAVPFVVETADRTVTALGTKFAVRAADSGGGVLVTQGKVRVSGQEKLLAAGDQIGSQVKTGRLARGLITPAPRATYALAWARDLMADATPTLVPASEHAGGALVAVDPAGQELKFSLRKYHIDVHVEDGFARTTIDQTYFNHETSRLEGTFYFPLPPDASISRLAMYVSGVLMEGGMAERDYARNVFESIKTKMQDPALLEWVDGSTFKMRVFPLEPREEKRIILSYTQRLSPLYGKTTYRFPAGHNLGEVREWSTKVVVKKGAPLEWSCPSHELAEKRTDGDLVLTASGTKVKPDKDVVVELSDAGERKLELDVPRFSATRQVEHQYLMLRYQPSLGPAVPADAARRKPRHWTILFETSADRDPLVARAQVEVARSLLRNVEHDDTFSVLSAGTNVRSWSPEPKAASVENVNSAIAWLEDTHLIGALDLEKALTAATKATAASRDNFLVHLGSGVPILGTKRDDELIKILPTHAKYVGIGVGKKWNRSLMKQAASKTGGYFTQINPDENIAWRSFDVISTLSAPRLLDILVTDDRGGELLCYADSLAHGEELSAIARYDAKQGFPANFTITGTLDGRPFRQPIKMADPSEHATYLPRMWAKLEIDRLVAADPAKHKDAIVSLSKDMYVMSPFTSLLVLENEAMYAQYKVDRGRKDHWAMYACPEKIPVVREPIETLIARALRTPPEPPVEVESARRSLADILATFAAPAPWPWNKHLFMQRLSVIDEAVVAGGATDRWGILTDAGLGLTPIPLVANFDVAGGIINTNGSIDAFYSQMDFYRRPGTVNFNFTPPEVAQFVLSGERLSQYELAFRQGGGSARGTQPYFTFDDGLTRWGATDFGLVPLAAGGAGGARLALGFEPAMAPFGSIVPQSGWAYRDGAVRLYSGFGGVPAGTTTFAMPQPHFLRLRDVDDLAAVQAQNNQWFDFDQDELKEREVLTQLDRGRGAERLFELDSKTALEFDGTELMLGRELFRYDLYPKLRIQNEALGERVIERQRRLLAGLEARVELQPLRKKRIRERYRRVPQVDFSAPWNAPQVALPNLRYTTPQVRSDVHAFRDLLSFAPAMQSTAADVLAVLEAEAESAKKPPQGRIDPSAKALIDRARTRGWRAIMLPAGTTGEKVTIHHDGAEKFRYQRRTLDGLLEQVVCDGRTLLHVYPEIGLAARREMSRHHRAELSRLVPWYLPPAEDLARGAHVTRMGQRTVAITPIESPHREKDTEKKDTKAATWAVQLEFDESGRLVSRRLVNTTDNKTLLRVTFDASGDCRWLDGDDKPIAQVELALNGAEPPNLTPDLSKLVVLPMPCRTLHHVRTTRNLGDVTGCAEWSEQDALAALASCVASRDAANTWQIIGRRFFNPAAKVGGPTPPDRRLGFYTLMISAGNLWLPEQQQLQIGPPPTGGQAVMVSANPKQDHPNNVWASQLTWLLNELYHGPQTPEPQPLARKEDGFAWRIAQQRRLVKAFSAGAADEALRIRALDYIKETPSPRLAWPVITLLQANSSSDARTRRELSDALKPLTETPGWRYAAVYERARESYKAGDVLFAQNLLADLFKRTTEAGYVPRLDDDFKRVFDHDNDGRARLQTLWRETGAKLISRDHRELAVLLALQCHTLGDAAIADELFAKALPGASADDKTPLSLLAAAASWEVGRYDRAESLIAPLLDDESLAKSARLWHLAADVADRLGRTALGVTRFERAVELALASLPKKYSVEIVRAPYRELFGRYRKLAAALATLEPQPPDELVARIVKAADRWRSLDSEQTEACQAASRVLATLGAADAAWEYVSTPLAEKPNEASPWLLLAKSLTEPDDFALADRAYREAFSAEATNAQILWDHAQWLEKNNRAADALVLYRQVAQGDWQPRFQSIKQQASQRVATLAAPK
jgi:ferric-dicitrate binding protein FerR (iron transport regulator)